MVWLKISPEVFRLLVEWMPFTGLVKILHDNRHLFLMTSSKSGYKKMWEWTRMNSKIFDSTFFSPMKIIESRSENTTGLRLRWAYANRPDQELLFHLYFYDTIWDCHDFSVSKLSTFTLFCVIRLPSVKSVTQIQQTI